MKRTNGGDDLEMSEKRRTFADVVSPVRGAQ